MEHILNCLDFQLYFKQILLSNCCFYKNVFSNTVQFIKIGGKTLSAADLIF